MTELEKEKMFSADLVRLLEKERDKVSGLKAILILIIFLIWISL
jgi:hypothetical protein